ncbi:hypothetical protein AB0C84_43715 [Actinomadura sp. NPDC048955]
MSSRWRAAALTEQTAAYRQQPHDDVSGVLAAPGRILEIGQ